MKKTAKFGGTSVAGPSSIKSVADIVGNDDSIRYVVVSAPGKSEISQEKVTDLLIKNDIDKVIKIFDAICSGLNVNRMDDVKSYFKKNTSYNSRVAGGEILNGMILADYLGFRFIDPREHIFIWKGDADNLFTRKKVSSLKDPYRYVIPGFVGRGLFGTQLLHRDGSNYSAAIVAAMTKSDVLENWSDQEGILTADPRVVNDTKKIDYMTFKELRELTFNGLKIFDDKAVEPLLMNKIPLHVRNTLNPSGEGTMISNYMHDDDSVRGIAGKTGFYDLGIYKYLLDEGIGVDGMISKVLKGNDVRYSVSTASVDDVTRYIHKDNLGKHFKEIVGGIHRRIAPDSLLFENSYALICIVGEKVLEDPHVSAKAQMALADNGIWYRPLGGSRRNIVLGVKEDNYQKAMQVIHDKLIR